MILLFGSLSFRRLYPCFPILLLTKKYDAENNLSEFQCSQTLRLGN